MTLVSCHLGLYLGISDEPETVDPCSFAILRSKLTRDIYIPLRSMEDRKALQSFIAFSNTPATRIEPFVSSAMNEMMASVDLTVNGTTFADMSNTMSKAIE